MTGFTPLGNPPLALVFLEPAALLGLVAPLILLALALRRRDPREAYLGTTRFFTEQESGATGKRKRSVPLWLVAAAAALALGVLALARPGYESQPPKGVLLEVVIDQSPSMYLPYRAAGAEADTPTQIPTDAAARRIDVAWDSFRRWAEDYEGKLEGEVYLALGPGDPVHWQDARLPEVPVKAEPEVPWMVHDSPSTIWLTDSSRHAEDRQRAGLFASGGDAVPGPVSLGAEGGIYWKADGTTEYREGLGRRGWVRVGPNVPAPVAELVEIWAKARGLRFGAPADSDPSAVELSVRCVPSLEAGATSATPRASRAGRDGWEAEWLVVSSAAAPPRLGAGRRPWLFDSDGNVLVSQAPGQIELGFQGLNGLPTDDAAFAVSWVELFDRARLSSSQVVEPSERRAAGPAASVPPAQPAILEAQGADQKRERLLERAAALRASLAAAAALLGLGALILVRGPRRSRA